MTIPGDIFWDCTAVAGQSFLAGDYAGRFVVGLEDRPEIADFVAARLQTIVHPPLLCLLGASSKLKSVMKEKSKQGAIDPWDFLDSDEENSASEKLGGEKSTHDEEEDESSDV